MIVPVDKYEIRPVVMDFESSEQGSFSTSAIYFGDVCLANSVDLVHFNEDPTQVIVCDKCGNTGCAGGGWVHLRRIGDDVIWIPRVPEKDDDDYLRKSFGPPAYMTLKQGIVPLFGPALYDDLRRRASTLPDRKGIQPICVREVLRLTQAEAPVDVLGPFKETPTLRRDLIVAVSDGDVAEETDLVAAFVAQHSADNAPMVPLVPGEELRIIEFYLDAPGFPAWRAFYHIAEGLGIVLQAIGPLGIVDDDDVTA